MLRDSKKMNPLNREETYAEILSLAETGKLTYGVGVISNDMIDAVGIREANRLAMEQALLQVLDKKLKLENSRLFIDGRDNYIFDIWDITPEYIIRGDSKIPQIMAASILAKVTRDKLMIEFEKTFPWYASLHGTKDMAQKLIRKCLKN